MLKKITKTLSNLPGWRTSRKIVVIESDDWGSLRMSSNEFYNTLQKVGLSLDKEAQAQGITNMTS
jgi:predicted RNA-binding protein with PIN domain